MGAVIGGYRLEKQIATSRISRVFSASDPDELGRLVAIKILRSEVIGSWLRAQFLTEGEIISTLSHSNVVKGLDRGEEGGCLYTVMEFLDGVTLARLLESLTATDNLDPRLWASVVASAADGVHALCTHDSRRRLVHCDISPGNIFVTRSGQVKVLDLGLMRPQGSRVQSGRSGELSGTYPYLAPERIRREPIDSSSDVFSLGIVLYEATTLTRLFAAESDEMTLENITNHRVRAPHLLVPDYPRGLEGIVMRALRPDSIGRFSNAGRLATALRRWISSAQGDVFGEDDVAGALARAVARVE